MCFGGNNYTAPAAQTATPTQQDAAVQASRDRQRQRMAAAYGYRKVNPTGGAGVSNPAPTAGKTLLGA